MGKPFTADRHSLSLRAEIAHQAARLIAEDHLHDFALAKKKAARHLGSSDARVLPSNQEIEEALESYRAIYQPQHVDSLQALRGKAVNMMRLLNQFTPYLTGSVLSGVAGPHSDINLLIYLDDPKSVEIFLLNHKIDYQHLEPPPTHRHASWPSIAFWYDDTQIKLHVRPRTAERQTQRKEERARVDEVEALLSANLAGLTPSAAY
ncbi:nucleotidyltransferase domain-containing protein [Amantichitinum ursilacus]|uniref:Polymerase nucleotidyl transferase domain-containing protein n=1 Tax=Amantichitinum ursilacus TaxID=857265 RepID=A0A0N0GPQ0_9NEIS|nr:nucleotidyltransferase domain-containing protein [Amantichitinum ursilacus]KPC53942.1 hypothetical protein WG78_04815 [Amantichitinum ursilacus]